jgi:tRNA (cmo5U34)-methyltransferase
VVSALAIHHLDDEAKQSLMGQLIAVLAPGGIFVNAEQVVAPTPVLDAHQVTAWRDAVVELGVTEEDLAAADRRMAADLCAPVEPQLDWLRSAGFVEVDAPFRDGRFAVLTGRRPA